MGCKRTYSNSTNCLVSKSWILNLWVKVVMISTSNVLCRPQRMILESSSTLVHDGLPSSMALKDLARATRCHAYWKIAWFRRNSSNCRVHLLVWSSITILSHHMKAIKFAKQLTFALLVYLWEFWCPRRTIGGWKTPTRIFRACLSIPRSLRSSPWSSKTNISTSRE